MTNLDMALEEIGFYTLSDERAATASDVSDMQRCEVLITGLCNFKCPYCRMTGPNGHASLGEIINLIDLWADDGLQNIRLSGGEPTVHPQLVDMVRHAKSRGIKRIALSTNGSAPLSLYHTLVEAGVNDFSISLDACCAEDATLMSGTGRPVFERIVSTIKEMSKLTYVTVGVVLNEENVDKLAQTVQYAHDLGVADIRVISAAQYNELLTGVKTIDPKLLDNHPILSYRVINTIRGRNVRGIRPTDSKQCWLALDDSVVVDGKHYPCVIHMREKGSPIGRVGPNMRNERVEWSFDHNTHDDPICSKNCLDVCVDYNNRAEYFNAFDLIGGQND
jgi:molybdenum cofactor biosynthesis enzyme MoaA